MHKYLIFFIFIVFQIVTVAGNEDGVLNLKVGNDKSISLTRFFQTVMPGDTFDFEIDTPNLESVVIKSNSGRIVSTGIGKWEYIAPTLSGNYEIIITDTSESKSIILTIFVLSPRSDKKGEYLNGYRIGNYPNENFKDRENYKKPEGFIEITKENKDIYITPHFQIKQFLCKQSSGWPKYLIINPKLLLKLEYLLNELNKSGTKANTIFIMSGYRTPYYNESIGNVKFSRHVFGDAADIYVDENLDGVIDDLNDDGKNDMADGMVMHSIISKLENNSENDHLIGGMGKYNKNSAHTYFIHVDTRGYKARW
ncbi:MAG: D-Ala-D-Ala carboxypeptidase family metallohydrolase [Bacteroidota bacterium]